MLFFVVFFTILTVFDKISYHLFEREKIWNEAMIQSGIIVFVLLIVKIFGFLDIRKNL